MRFKKYFQFLCNFGMLVFLTMPITSHASTTLTERLGGRIVLQVESYGRGWYVDPVQGVRYYLKDGQTAFDLMRSRGLGITNTDLARIPTQAGESGDRALIERVKGRILLQVEEHGEAWYVNPVDGLRYYMPDGESAFALMRSFGLGISTADLANIPMNTTQLVHDTTFADVAYAVMKNGVVTTGSYTDQLLPPASMTKILTALVLFEQGVLDKKEVVIIEQNHLDYPKTFVGEDKTSEVDLVVGDHIAVKDLWTAMLVASSNQATIALVDASGLTRAEFITAMNAKVRELGLEHSQFFDPTGLDAHNVTTPRDMALIATAAFAIPEIANTTRVAEYTITTQNTNRDIVVIDRNYSLRDFIPDAVKTGYLVEAERCVVLKKGNTIIVVMHARSMTERNGIITRFL